jgi:hypothetical protein
MDIRLAQMETQMNTRFTEMEKRLMQMDIKLDTVIQKVDALKVQQ